MLTSFQKNLYLWVRKETDKVLLLKLNSNFAVNSITLRIYKDKSHG